MFFPAGENPEFRIAELGNRCFLGRHAIGSGDTVIGIGISEYIVATNLLRHCLG